MKTLRLLVLAALVSFAGQPLVFAASDEERVLEERRKAEAAEMAAKAADEAAAKRREEELREAAAKSAQEKAAKRKGRKEQPAITWIGHANLAIQKLRAAGSTRAADLLEMQVKAVQAELEEQQQATRPITLTSAEYGKLEMEMRAMRLEILQLKTEVRQLRSKKNSEKVTPSVP
jgi:hypothetical protein